MAVHVPPAKTKQRHKIRYLFCLHFLLCFVVLAFGVWCNGGRKYISADPKKSAPPKSCERFFVNVYSTSPDEPGATICCTTTTTTTTTGREDHHHHPLFSYEGFLCHQKLSYIPLARSLTRYPDSWLLPLIPIGLRLIIEIFGRLAFLTNGSGGDGNGSTNTGRNGSRNTRYPTTTMQPRPPHDIWTSIKRLLFYIFIMFFRGWGLYIALNEVEDTILRTFWPPDHTNHLGDDSSLCWYTDLLRKKKRGKLDAPCYGQTFDFSDHVVLFFSHYMPAIIFEALFCVVVPSFWPFDLQSQSQERKKITSMKRSSSSPGGSTRRMQRPLPLIMMMHFVLNSILPTLLLMAFVYLNIITLLAVHATAAYFHSPMEIIVGYLISLIVQIPVGLILCSDDDGSGWGMMRKFVGFP